VGRRVPIDEEELPVIPIGNGEPSTESDVGRRMPVGLEVIPRGIAGLGRGLLNVIQEGGMAAGRASLINAAGAIPEGTPAGDSIRRVLEETKDVGRIQTPVEEVTATTPAEEMSDAELEEILKMMEAPDSTDEPEAKKKREIDWDLLREMGAGMAGQTSVGGALGAGASAVGEELRRRETMASEEAQQAADRKLKMLLAEYDYDIAERKMLSDLSKVYTEAQLEIAADTLAGLDLNPDYMEAVDELADIYKGNPDAYRAAVQELKDRLVSEAVSATLRGAGVMGGSAPTTGSQSFNSFDTIGS